VLWRFGACCLLTAVCAVGCSSGTGPGAPLTVAEMLAAVRTWACQLQRIDEPGAVDALVASPYDLLIVEPTRSSKDLAEFDTAGMVLRLKASTGSTGNRKLVIAYVNIGQAEEWRWYWGGDWVAPTADAAGTPDFLLTVDPEGWAGDYPVAFWDPRWREIAFSGEGSALSQVVDDGFDGVFMDWVEAYDDPHVQEAAQAAGLDPFEEMISFIGALRASARARNPEFIVVQNNGTTLSDGRPEAFEVIDAIVHEGVWYRGGAGVGWDDPVAGDEATPTGGEPYTTEWYVTQLQDYQRAGKVVFTLDYARQPEHVVRAYRESRALDFRPFVSLSPLDRLP